MAEVTQNFYGNVIFNDGATQNGDITINNPTYYNSNAPQGYNPRMPHYLSQRQATMLCTMLKNKAFLSDEQNVEMFCHVMGCVEVEVESFKPIKWIKNVQLLREMVETVYQELIDKKALTKAELERCVSRCFVNEKNTPIMLSKPKNSGESHDSLILCNILATILSR